MPADCGRRARKLFADRHWLKFICRRCAGLTYRSAQQHNSRLDLARRDREGFFESRARAPKALRSGLVTAHLLTDATLNPYRPGRGWGRRPTTTWTRIADQLRQEYIDRWGFPPEESGRVARGG